jgi:hypothetical protein
VRESESAANLIPINLKNRTPLLVAGQKELEGLPTPADQSESVHTIFYRDDFVLLTDGIKYWIVRIEDISLLEAHRNFTLVGWTVPSSSRQEGLYCQPEPSETSTTEQ